MDAAGGKRPAKEVANALTHAVWHLFVLAGSAFHFAAVAISLLAA